MALSDLHEQLGTSMCKSGAFDCLLCRLRAADQPAFACEGTLDAGIGLLNSSSPWSRRPRITKRPAVEEGPNRVNQAVV